MKLGPFLSLENFIFPLPPKESINFDMKRAIAKLDFPGGPPIYQDMGMAEKILEFSGSIIGENAIGTSLDVETLWWSGRELQFNYGDIKKRVRIENYKVDIRRDDRADYTIRLIVCFPESELPKADTGTPIPMLVQKDSLKTVGQVYDRAYTLKWGDTLWEIASRADVLGNGTKWGLIAEANGITDEYGLQPGQVIKLPRNAADAEKLSQKMYAAVLGPTGAAELAAIEKEAN
ncbi:LysM peptidoglycan-binding domain-containing protein [Paenibacillus elgii]